MTLAQLVDEYLLDVARLYQPSTERKYGQILDYLIRDIGDKTPIESITESDILRCLYRWKDRKPATKRLHVTVFKCCFKYAVEKDYLNVSPAAKIKPPKQPRAGDVDVLVVSTDDIRRMFSACQNWGDEICLGVLACTGARRSAASRLRWSDLDLKPDNHAPNGWMRTLEKGNKIIDKPIPYFLREIIDRAPPHDPDDYVIPNRRPNAVTRKERSHQIVYDRVKAIAARAGVEAHVHGIRAAFAVFFLETHRGSIKSLQMWLGHERLETTQHYTRGLDKRQLMAEGLGLDWGALNGEGNPSVEPVTAGLGPQGPSPLSALTGAGGSPDWVAPRDPGSSQAERVEEYDGPPVPVSALSEGGELESDEVLYARQDAGSAGVIPSSGAARQVNSPSESTLEVEERVS